MSRHHRFELSLVRNPSANALFAVNQVVNLIFIVDIFLQFFLPIKTSVKEGGRTIRDHRIIAKAYLRGFFVIDFLSVIPLDIVDVAGAPPTCPAARPTDNPASPPQAASRR